MALTSAALEAQLILIQAQITAALANTVGPRWKVGDVEFESQGSALMKLFEMQREVVDQMRNFPGEVIDTVQNGVGDLGNDSAEYYGEDL